MTKETYTDIDTEKYGNGTEFRENECDAPNCEEPLTVVVPCNGSPYIPREHISHSRFGVDVKGTLAESDAHFCSPECFDRYRDNEFRLSDRPYETNIGKFALEARK